MTASLVYRRPRHCSDMLLRRSYPLGPQIAAQFDTVNNGGRQLNCTYPTPLPDDNSAHGRCRDAAYSTCCFSFYHFGELHWPGQPTRTVRLRT